MTAKKQVKKQVLTFVNLDGVKIGDRDAAQYQRIDGHWKMAIGKGAWASVGDKGMITELEKLASARIQSGAIQVVQNADGSAVVATKDEIEFKRIAQEIVDDTLKIGQKWLNLCKFIRTKKIDPKAATKWLLDLGFHKSKASEVNRVAQAPDEVFSQFEARMIGWRGVLQLSRGNLGELKQATVVETDPELQSALKEVEAELVMEEEKQQAAAEAASADPKEVERAKKQAARSAFIKAGVKVLSMAEKFGFKPRLWKNGELVLELRKAKPGEYQGDIGDKKEVAKK